MKAIIPPIQLSAARRARVVQDTERLNLRMNSFKPIVEGGFAGAGRRRQDKNDPLPSWPARWSGVSFDVLGLLADLFNPLFALENELDDGQIRHLRTDRVQLPIDFLEHEIDFFPDRFAFASHAGQVCNMGLQPDYFFIDIAF